MRISFNKKPSPVGKPVRGRLFFFLFCALFFVSALLCTVPSGSCAADKAPGKKAPDFTLNDIYGKPVSLSGFKGKVVLLNFWGTWCYPCRAEMPSMDKLYSMYKDKGLVVIGVSTDRAVSDVKDYIINNPLSFPVVVDYKLAVSRPLYKVNMMPTTFLIDRRGVVVGKYFGEQDWTSPEIIKEIEALL